MYLHRFALRGPSDRLRRKLLDTEVDDQAISVVTLAELLLGVRLSSKIAQNRAALTAFTRHLAVLDFIAGAADHFADIRAQLQRKGTLIGANNLLITAHARSLPAVIVTINESEFRRVPGLKVENWV
ncbi:MAG: PIN domain-containing protein [Burkholderiales bacterium]